MVELLKFLVKMEGFQNDVAAKLSIEFVRISEHATSCFIGVGMITDKMLSFARKKLINCKDLRIVTGIHMPTTPSVLRTLRFETISGNMNSGIFIKKYFHPKLYLFEIADKWVAFVGSGNFTNGGWFENEELFIKVTDEWVIQKLKLQFECWQNQSEEITDIFINKYEQRFEQGMDLERMKRKNIQDLVDSLNSDFNIDNIDFSTQFFKKHEVMAFEGWKTKLDTPEVLEDRSLTRRKLYRLNDLVFAKMPKEWGLHEHYDQNHIASQIECEHHHEFNVRSLWVGYGRNKSQLKKYGGLDATPLYYMRMQFILRLETFGIWLMPGKINGGKADRENFLRLMTGDEYCSKFFNLLSDLGPNYWIEIANQKRDANSFKDVNEFREYALGDSWRKYYFIIGRDYAIGSAELSIDNIVMTCIKDFEKYHPMYEMIMDRSFD
ncbi:phospholipase D-like domain-containing protein [Pedobacter sp. Du54]|uniref:phospholipase D family protein n=1 Tax=Pedobacter anseongensis TaxID=3133439 RepID=UPI0030AF154A